MIIPMRIVGLFVLATFFPTLVHASVIFTEIMYDYPGTEENGAHTMEERGDGGGKIW